MVEKVVSDTLDAGKQGELGERLSHNISARRKELGLTQAQLAERLGVDTETLSRFERGKHLPSLTTLERLAGLLSMTVGELLADQPVSPSGDAILVANRLAALDPADREFVLDMFMQHCDFLIRRKARP